MNQNLEQVTQIVSQLINTQPLFAVGLVVVGTAAVLSFTKMLLNEDKAARNMS